MPKKIKTESSFQRNKTTIIIAGSFTLLVVVLFVIGTVRETRAENARKAAVAAEQARLAADPITSAGVYTAVNKERVTVGTHALATVGNLTTAAGQLCSDMVTSGYFDYKNPITGKAANDFITDNTGDLYLKTFVSSIFSGQPTTQTATDIVGQAAKAQAVNINNPIFNSVGWAVCDDTKMPGNRFVVGMFADKEDKPVPAASAAPVYRAPTYRAPTTCNTQYHTYGGYFDPSATTTCY
jgi:uncharacterized protein YkwD